MLLVDDNQSNLDILMRVLRSWGMDPVSTREPMRAPELLEQAIARGQKVDLAILDHQMPELDGLSLARELRRLSSMPMVLLTSLGTTMEQTRQMKADIAAVLTKPVHRSSLQETLCAVLAPALPGTAVTPGAVPDPAPIPPLRLLLAEDNLVNRKVALLLLRKLGYTEVDVAVDGLEAVAAVRGRPYDVVLMDVQMPNLDGLDATRRIRAEVDADRQPQIIAMTANALAEDREACTAAGMDDYVAKPIDVATLTRALLNAAALRGIAAPAQTSDRKPSPREEADLRAKRIANQVLAGGGEMGQLMRATDWAATPVGPVYTWPQSLRTALSILLTQKHPIFLFWGRELVQFYNDAYRPILGTTKHPRAMGQLGRECFAEVWPQLAPMIEDAFDREQSSMVERGLLCLDRHGFVDEAYFTYGYSPIRDESGAVAGIFVACSENTADVLAARRSELLLRLDDRYAPRPGGEWPHKRDLLAKAVHDLPFALIYRVDGDGGSARRVGACGLADRDPAAPASVSPGDGSWPILETLRSGTAQVHAAPVPLPTMAPWPEPPTRALLLPIGDGRVLVAGLSPRLALDDAYRAFLHRVAQRLAAVPDFAPA